MEALFAPFPKVSLAELPTPIVRLAALGRHCGHERLYMKRDDLSGPVYGGNKIRKLEFLLGEAVAEGRRTVVTYGAAGSNHALATAICCRRLGLRSISILAPQMPSDHVRKNLLMGHAAGAELHLLPHYSAFPQATQEITERCMREDGMPPYIIPPGGTNATGALGYVKAALEMAEQIRPDVVYVPMGTGGTLAGLLVGFAIAGLSVRIEAVRVVDPALRDESHIARYVAETSALLGKPGLRTAEIAIRNGFLGEGYGIPTPEGHEAVELFSRIEGIGLENTYTGKTAAALLHDLRSERMGKQTVLYWNTLNSRDFSAAISGIDYHELPTAFHSCFE